jgi:hypothetical protein
MSILVIKVDGKEDVIIGFIGCGCMKSSKLYSNTDNILGH